MKQFIPHTNEQHRMWEWVAADYANFKSGASVGSTPDKVSHEQARQELKVAYMKAIDYMPSNNPIEEFWKSVDEMEGLTEEQRLNLKLSHIKSIQDLKCIQEKAFSTKQSLFSKTSMSKFLEFCISTLKEYNIPFRAAIMELFKEEEEKQYTWICLKYKMCEVCGTPGDLHHVDQVGSEGYASDDGRNRRVTCLCRKHHLEVHSDHRAVAKYGIKGIYLNDNQIKILKPIYKNHFKAFKEEEKNVG